MAVDDLQRHLEASFKPEAAAHLDAVMRITAGAESLTFRVHHGALTFEVPPGTPPDATFMFEDFDTVWALLRGRADAFEAFMDGRFRSDGYLMWAFTLMAMFESRSLPESPTE